MVTQIAGDMKKIGPLAKLSAHRAEYFVGLTILFLTGLRVFLNPFPGVSAVKEICFYAPLILFVFYCFRMRRVINLKTPLMLPFSLFTVWALIGLFFALNKGNSFHDIYSHLIRYILIYLFISVFFDTREKFLGLVWIVILSTAFFALGGLIYFYILTGHPLTERFTTPGFVPHREILYEFSLVLAMYCVTWEKSAWRKTALALCIGALVSAILFTQTRSALIAVFVSIIILFHKSKRLLFVMALLLAVILVSTPIKDRLSDDTMRNNIRLDTGMIYVEMVRDNPLFGIGFGMQTYQDPKLMKKYVEGRERASQILGSPHNWILEIAVRTGIIGLGLFSYILFAFFKMYAKVRTSGDELSRGWGFCVLTALIVFFIQGMFVDTQFGGQAVALYTIFAMMTILWRFSRAEARTETEEKFRAASA